MKYEPKKIEAKWQKVWEKKKIYQTLPVQAGKGGKRNPSTDSTSSLQASSGRAGKKYYALFEFPYPSGDGLHVGHLRPYIGMDLVARKRRMEGYDVLFPIGWDAFGLPTENYAIKHGIDPAVATKRNTDNFRKQFKQIGTSLDWSREINTTDPNYYKWTQWMFLKFFEKGLAYKAKTLINWCPKDKIGLANEEAAGGVCDRCGGPVEKREKEQWMIRITDYADKLLAGLDELGVLEKISDQKGFIPQAKTQQENWIGRSEGAEIEFEIVGSSNKIKVFTTRPDTLFGATYLVVAPEHKALVFALKNPKALLQNKDEVSRYIESVRKKNEVERTSEGGEISGVELKGLRVINPATKEEIPVWTADYVLAGYGTGAIMAVPAHDERDYAFAKKHALQIKNVLEPAYTQTTEPGIVRPELPFDHRDAIIAVVKHWKDDKYMALKWKQVAWGTFVTGGIEKGQTPEEAGKMEIREETGFTNLKFIKNYGLVHGKFYHVPKKLNRFAHAHFLYFELQSDARESVSVDEQAKHDIKWLTIDELKNFLTPDTHQHGLRWLTNTQGAFTGEGILTNSGEFNGLASEEARAKVTAKFGKIKVQYKLRDWVFSRQRYWGEPIPLVHCAKDGWVALPEKDLPLKLPKVKKYQPTDTGESPLANIKSFVNVKCPKCKGPAKRETDTMPNWAGSSWYFLRYADPDNKKEFASAKALKYWMPVDWYNGGMEHTVLHLLYSRFWNMFLYDLKLVPTSEPYKKRTSHGLILAEGGVKMSKSKGNVVNPDDLVKEFGADALRLYEMFLGPFDQAVAWDSRGILGTERFLRRIWELAGKISTNSSARVIQVVHKTVKKVSDDIEAMSFNTAVSAMMVLSNELAKEQQIGKKEWGMLLKILAPFAPHIAEELWFKLQTTHYKLRTVPSIHIAEWPKYDPALIAEDRFELIIQVNGKMRGKLSLSTNASQADAEKVARAHQDVSKWITGEPKKVIYVKNRLINFIV